MRRAGQDLPVPIECRNRLYVLLIEALEGRLSLEALLAEAEALARRVDWADYVSDRMRRMESALRACQIMASAPDRLGRDLRIGAALFNEGLFFDCHEYLEGAWRRAEGEDKLMIQGLVQAAAGLHKLELGSAAGAAELLGKAESKLRSGRAPRWMFATAFATQLERARRRILDGTWRTGEPPKLDVP